MIFMTLLFGDRGVLRPMALFGTMLLVGVTDSKSAALHFEGRPALYNSGHEIRDVAVGDFDGDGRQDAVAAVESGIVFFRGNGDGTLSVPMEIASKQQSRLLAVDLEPDGRTDLIGWYRLSNVIRIYRGSDSGLVADTSYALGSTVSDVKAGDFNADGARDLLVSAGTRVEVLFGTRGGRFDAPRLAIVRATDGSLALEDLNGDGRLDLASYGGNWKGHTWITVALGLGTGEFGTLRQSYYRLVPGPLVVAEVTGDGKVDLAYTSADNTSGTDILHYLTVQPGRGDGSFGSVVSTAIPGYVSRMMARNLDHDGRIDLLLASGLQVMSLMGNGDGTFTRGETAVMPWPVAGFGLADLDRDGLEDLVAGTRSGSGRDDLVVIKGSLNHAPVARCRDAVVEAGPGCVARASIDDGSSDPDGDAVTVVQAPAGPYPLGVTHVTLTCTDANGATATCAATVTVVDATAPVLSLAVDPTTLWPPNRQLVPVRVTATARDGCDEQPSITLASIVSSDPDPNHEDIRGATIGTADFDFELRAEREGKNSDRSYTICYGIRDDAGNEARQCVVVHVQHDPRARVEGTQAFQEAPGQVSTFEAALAVPPGRGLIGLRYSIPHVGHVRVSIYDVAGHRVARPFDGPQAAGWHQVSFAGGNASQLLFYRVEWGGRSLSGRIPFLR